MLNEFKIILLIILFSVLVFLFDHLSKLILLCPSLQSWILHHFQGLSALLETLLFTFFYFFYLFIQNRWELTTAVAWWGFFWFTGFRRGTRIFVRILECFQFPFRLRGVFFVLAWYAQVGLVNAITSVIFVATALENLDKCARAYFIVRVVWLEWCFGKLVFFFEFNCIFSLYFGRNFLKLVYDLSRFSTIVSNLYFFVLWFADP